MNKGMVKNIIIIFTILISTYIWVYVRDYSVKYFRADCAALATLAFFMYCGIAIKLFDYSRKSNIVVLFVFFLYVALGTFGIVPRIVFTDMFYIASFAYIIILGAVIYEFVKMFRTCKIKESEI